MSTLADYYNSIDGVFPTTPAAPISYQIPQAFTGPANGDLTLAQELQKAGVDPGIMGGLLFGAYANPAFQAAATTGNTGWSTPKQNLAYIADLKRPRTEAELTKQRNDEAGWRAMQLGSGVYNPNGANTMQIQNGGGNTPLPLFKQPIDNIGNNGSINNTNPHTQTTTPTGTNGGALSLRSGTSSGLTSTGNPQYSQPFLAQLGNGAGLQQANTLTQSPVGPDSWNGQKFNKALWR